MRPTLLLAAALVLAVSGAPAASASTSADHYIVFVDYYSDAAHTTLVGSRTWNDCPGEEGTYGWGLQTEHHVTTSELC